MMHGQKNIKYLKVAILKTRQVTKIYVQCKNADTFAPFYITPKHIHLTGKKCGPLDYYAAISCNSLPTCIGW
jgi:hypothetical protein